MAAKSKKDKDDKPKQPKVTAEDLKKKSAEQILIERCGERFGKSSVVRLADDEISSVKEFVDTGSYIVNELISNGRGWPVGKIVTIAGEKSSGKSTLAAHLLAGAQKLNAIPVLIDTECAFDSDRAKVIGVDVDNVLMGYPNCMEQCFEYIEEIIAIARAADRLVVIVWDSIAATPTRKEMEGNFGEGGFYGEHSKILSAGFRRLMKLVSENRVILYCVAQIKVNINASMFESKDTFLGQKPLEFHSHIMIRINQCGQVKDANDNVIGIESRVKVIKNRVAPPFRQNEIHILFDRGVDRAWEAIEIGKKYQRARLGGSWNEICKPCPDCLGEPKNCETCKKTGIVHDETYKKFYTKDIGEMLEQYPGLEQWLVTGVWPKKKEVEKKNENPT
jgi:recombination protein RecA